MTGLSAVLLAALISPAAPAGPPVDLTVAPDLSGTWEGKGWGTVTLRRTDGGYEGTYTDTYGKDTGRISLRWSRRSGGFEGAWSEGKYRFGRLSVRAEGGGKPVEGNYRADPGCEHQPGTPASEDFQWTRAAK